VPGPGAYDTNKTLKSSSFSLPKSQRKSLADDKNVPGPFTYNPKPVFQSQYQTIGIGTDLRRENIKKEGPGPGEYFKDQKALTNGFTYIFN